jgi:hypothetical protein
MLSRLSFLLSKLQRMTVHVQNLYLPTRQSPCSKSSLVICGYSRYKQALMEIVSLNGSYLRIAIERLTGQLAKAEHPEHCAIVLALGTKE